MHQNVFHSDFTQLSMKVKSYAAFHSNGTNIIQSKSQSKNHWGSRKSYLYRYMFYNMGIFWALYKTYFYASTWQNFPQLPRPLYYFAPGLFPGLSKIVHFSHCFCLHLEANFFDFQFLNDQKYFYFSDWIPYSQKSQQMLLENISICQFIFKLVTSCMCRRWSTGLLCRSK